jgi:hypothetical protein
MQLISGGPVTTVTAIPDINGNFTAVLGVLPSGTYNYWLKQARYLATAGTLTLTGLCITTHEFGTQPAGDINNDNCVDIVDFTMLQQSFGRICGDLSYNATADYNDDCVVDVQDFTLLRSNFGTCGAAPLIPSAAKPGAKSP